MERVVAGVVRGWIWLAGLLVPRAERARWREEWRGDLEAARRAAASRASLVR